MTGGLFDQQTKATLFAATTLSATSTSMYAGSPAGKAAQLMLLFSYTPAQNNRKVTIQIQCSDDGTTYYPQITTEANSASGDIDIRRATYTVQDSTSSGTAYTFALPVQVAFSHIRVMAYEDGVATFGTLACKIIISGQ